MQTIHFINIILHTFTMGNVARMYKMCNMPMAILVSAFQRCATAGNHLAVASLYPDFLPLAL